MDPPWGPVSTDPVAGGAGRRKERTTGAEALRAGAPAAPYIRPPARPPAEAAAEEVAAAAVVAAPAPRPPEPLHAYITTQQRGHGRFVTQAGPGRRAPSPAAAAARPPLLRAALESRPRLRPGLLRWLQPGPAASLALCPATDEPATSAGTKWAPRLTEFKAKRKEPEIPEVATTAAASPL